MPVNVTGGRQTVVHAKQTTSIVSTGINSTNTAIIYLIDDVVISYVPGRSINGFTQFTKDKGYLIKAFEDMDLSEYFFLLFRKDLLQKTDSQLYRNEKHNFSFTDFKHMPGTD